MQRLKEEVNAAYKKAEKLPKPPVEEMFMEVYGGELPWNLVRCGLTFLWLCYCGEMDVLADCVVRLCRRNRGKS